MPVFISHKYEDSGIANDIARYLTDRKVLCYIDLVDTYLTSRKTPQELTDHIISQIKRCTHLLAFVTPATQASWWVPFEIGTAHQLQKKIITCNTNYRSLPEYLRIWPVLESESRHTLVAQLDRFIEFYENEMTVSKSIQESRRPFESRPTPQEFNQTLKAVFGQL